MATDELTLHLTFESANEPWDAIASLALARFLGGTEPLVHTFGLTGVTRAADLVPLDAVRRHVTDAGDDSERLVARGAGWTALVERMRNGRAQVTVAAVDPEQLAKAVTDIRARGPEDVPPPDTLEIDFWFADRGCTRSVTRRIDAPAWDEIRHHYPAVARRQVETLVAMRRPASTGRLLLWHGPPGTGKTTAIRALVREWSDWCRALFITDAERFLGDASYLISVVLGADDFATGDEQPKWRLLVLEDADELLRADAKRQTGQSLSRLLSLSDGFIGQGVNLLVLITTNEPVGRLHPAVTRPGRCLADVAFGALSPTEAAALLGRDAPAGELTLAEVFERQGRLTRVAAAAVEPSTGQYL
ncbi:MAG: DUF5925 domain-containing protein [Acidimicrobiales bacterium]